MTHEVNDGQSYIHHDQVQQCEGTCRNLKLLWIAFVLSQFDFDS